MIGNNLLVSVLVVTFNSGTTIIETLESIKRQTYKNIELIITDDGSVDNTINLCKQWLDSNGIFFKNQQLITASANTGIPANCNRGLKAANGVWIKLIAGDDTLKDTCIQINMDYVALNNEIEILQTEADLYIETFVKTNFRNTLPVDFKEFFELSNGEMQYKFLKNVGYAICSPSIFIKKSTVEKAGGFDERYRFMEDLPLWLKLTKMNIKFFYLPISTVNYRSHDKSVARNGKKYTDTLYAKNYLFFLKSYFPKKERSLRIKRNIIKYNFHIILNKMGLNNSSKFSYLIYALINRI